MGGLFSLLAIMVFIGLLFVGFLFAKSYVFSTIFGIYLCLIIVEFPIITFDSKKEFKIDVVKQYKSGGDLILLDCYSNRFIIDNIVKYEMYKSGKYDLYVNGSKYIFQEGYDLETSNIIFKKK